MAHSCPYCDQVCHCGGDIDDMILDGTPEQDQCMHCEGVYFDDDEEFDDDTEPCDYGAYDEFHAQDDMEPGATYRQSNAADDDLPF